MTGPNDTYAFFRAEDCPVTRDGKPFFLTVVNDENSVVYHAWILSFPDLVTASAAAEALVVSGKYRSVFINEQRRALRRA